MSDGIKTYIIELIKVFIGCSGRTKVLGEAMRNYLTGHGLSAENVRLWWEAICVGHNIIDELLRNARECDFAIIFLTEDDVLCRGANQGLLAPRDNCVFELGLFAGAFDSPSRCFILTSADKNALPSDLQGLNYIPLKIEQQRDLNDISYCNAVLQIPARPPDNPPAAKILDAITRDLLDNKRKNFHLLPAKELMLKERRQEEGGLLLSTEDVVVKSGNPAEQDYDFAVRVLNNMKGAIKYKYFFDATANVRTIVSVIQNLAVAGIPNLKNSWRMEIAMGEHQQQVKENLDLLKLYLRIYFFKNKRNPPPPDFCVYNASSQDSAISYLRYQNGWLEWHQGILAKVLAENLCRLETEVDRSNRNQFVFRSSNDVTLDSSNDLKRDLLDQLRRSFHGDLQTDMEGVCFGSQSN